jgi:hypothetical protein
MKSNPILIKQVKDSALFFNSRFESGNLYEVEKLNEMTYNLYLNFDFNTLNYTQWYYFSIRNIRKGKIYLQSKSRHRLHLYLQYHESPERGQLL